MGETAIEKKKILLLLQGETAQVFVQPSKYRPITRTSTCRGKQGCIMHHAPPQSAHDLIQEQNIVVRPAICTAIDSLRLSKPISPQNGPGCCHDPHLSDGKAEIPMCDSPGQRVGFANGKVKPSIANWTSRIFSRRRDVAFMLHSFARSHPQAHENGLLMHGALWY